MSLLALLQDQQEQLQVTSVTVEQQFIFGRQPKPRKPPFPVRLPKGSTEIYRLQWELFWDKFCPHKVFRYSATRSTGEFRRCTHAKCCERRTILSEEIAHLAQNFPPLGGERGVLILPALQE